jgi:hypothetical protein
VSDPLLGDTGNSLEPLEGAELAFQPYRQQSPEWDHDHCLNCDAGISEDDPTDLHEGWTTTGSHPDGAEYHWICSRCFEKRRGDVGWRAVSDP